MKKNFRKKIITCACVLFGAVMLFVPGVAAETEKVSFQTEKEVIAAADGYFILQDETTNKYGLYNGKGKNVIPCEYDVMEFPQDTIAYDYLVVKQGSNWGILRYDGSAMIDVKYSSVSPYADGRKIATAYDGNKTQIFNDRGRQVGILSGEYTPIADDVFKGNDTVKNRKNVDIFSLNNQKLLFQRKNGVWIANVYQLGKNVVADYNVGSAKDPSLDEMYGKISTYRYIKVLKTSGDRLELQKITPDPEWTANESETIRGGVRIEKVISDHSLIVRLMGYKENYLAIYDTNKKAYSELFLNIGDFYNGKAFAANEEGELYIIDTSGEKVSSHEVKVTGYERLGIKQSKHDPFIIFKKEGEENYKLYCLKINMTLEDSFQEVIFQRDEKGEEICHGYPIVSDGDGKYTILNREGSPVFDYGSYEKEDLVKHTLYSDTNITVITQKNEIYEVNSYQVAKSVKQSLFEGTKVLQIFGVIVIGGIIVIVCLSIIRGKRRRAIRTRYRRKRLVEEKQPTSVPVTTPPVIEKKKEEITPITPKEFYGQLNCLTGEYAGAKIAMQDLEWIRIGRDASENDLVMKQGTISRKHCAIHYDTYQHIYYVIDYSRNGVFLENGSKLPGNEEVAVTPGSKIYLGNNQTVIELAPDPLI